MKCQREQECKTPCALSSFVLCDLWMVSMKTSDKGIALIKEAEGFSNVPYLCPAGKWTIGYGETSGVTKDSPPMSESEATKLLAKSLEKYEATVLDAVEVPLTQNQFDALVSLTYNIGQAAFRGSTLVRLLNANDYKGAAGQFERWNRGGGKVLPGLVNRRQKEMELFTS